jgi:hypothetical protein
MTAPEKPKMKKRRRSTIVDSCPRFIRGDGVKIQDSSVASGIDEGVKTDFTSEFLLSSFLLHNSGIDVFNQHLDDEILANI